MILPSYLHTDSGSWYPGGFRSRSYSRSYSMSRSGFYSWSESRSGSGIYSYSGFGSGSR